MPARPAPALVLRGGDRDRLLSLTRSRSARAGLAQRARIVLLAAEGVANTEIAARVGVARQTVLDWRARYERDGVAGLADEPRSGRPRTVDRAEIIAATLAPLPKKLGVTHWSSRVLADHLGIGNATVARAWRAYGAQPWRSGTFKFSTDPQLVVDVVRPYLSPPENAIVLCVDEKSQIQALDRTAPLRLALSGSALQQRERRHKVRDRGGPQQSPSEPGTPFWCQRTVRRCRCQRGSSVFLCRCRRASRSGTGAWYIAGHAPVRYGAPSDIPI